MMDSASTVLGRGGRTSTRVRETVDSIDGAYLDGFSDKCMAIRYRRSLLIAPAAGPPHTMSPEPR
jgi:hypothetical protein